MQDITQLSMSLVLLIGSLAPILPTPYSGAVANGGPPFGAGSVIADAADGAWSVTAADVDSDGDLDVLSASEYDDKIAWYENDGGSPPAFTSHVITTAADGAMSVTAADVDGDGDLDVLSASDSDHKIVWYENDGGSPPAFTDHIITTAANGAMSVTTADVDGDGDPDVLSASRLDNKIAWYENDGRSPPAFTPHIVTTAVDSATSVHAADLDGDGDLDVLSTSWGDDKVAWYENDGGSPPAFTPHVITTAADAARLVRVADVDGDGDLDVLSVSVYDDKIAWYENDGGSSPAFTPHVITTTAGGARSVHTADVDGDGDLDVLSASAYDDKIAWYENDGGSPPAFTPHVIATTADYATSVHAADVDGDGDLDVLSASLDDDKIAWHENRGGQFALATTDTAPATMVAGEQDDVLQIVVTHQGQASDTDAELATLELLFEESAGDPLTTAEANDLIENLRIYRDDGSGVFELGVDTMVTTVGTLSLVGGTQTVTFADGDPDVRVVWGSPVTIFVVVELAGDAGSQTVNQFRVTHVTDPKGLGRPRGSTAEDRDHDLPLALEFAPNVASSICRVSTPGTDGDAYEIDDTCVEATLLATDGTVQQHTFHKYADEDWARFTVVSGTTYVVQATSTSADADLILELYDGCGGNLEGSDDNAFGNDARVIFTVPSDGTYYVKALNQDPAVYGPDVTYELSVRAQTPGGVVLIVAGHDDSYSCQANILYAANRAYRTFLGGGIPKSNVRYLSAVDDDDRTDADGDGVSDVYASSASANVEAAITTWAANLADSHTPFYLYLIDHGLVDAFKTDGSADTITPDELDGWLNALEAATGTPVSVVYEACHSGSFVDGLEEISKPGRVVIASTGRENSAYAAPGRGAYFSDALFTALGQSQDLYTAFQWGAAAVEANGLWQTPWLDDNGNAVPNETDDGEVARGRGLANFAFAGGRPPVIDRVLPPTSIQEGEGIIRAQVRDDGDVRQVAVWAVVYPPSFVEPEPSPDGTMPDLGLPEVDLSDSDGDGEYAGVYEDFTEDGVYRLVVYAEDGEGNLSQPGVLEMRAVWPIFLPLVLR